MTALFALGIHRDMTDAEARAKLGAAGDLGLRWLNHRPRDPGAQVDLGVTRRGTPVRLNRHLHEADLVICVGLIEPHLLLGFGGGLKMILPGLAHETTIQRNHLQGVTPDRYNYVGEVESPMRLDLEEAAGKLGRRIFVVNAVLGEGLEVSRFLCGDPLAAHREGAALVAEACGRPVASPVDVAIVASDPMNADLRQGMKCIGNVERSVRDDGLIVGLLECRNGIGDVAVPPRALPNRVLRFVLRRLGRGRVMWFIDKVKKGAGVEERFMAHFSMQVVREKQILVHSRRLPPDAGKRLGLFVQHPSPEALMAAARAYAPRRARVLVYPQGGITYPVLGRPR
jgi:nickel-dependent lactate racemase